MKSMFNLSLFVFYLFGSYCVICYGCIVQDFIPIWIGQDYVMSYSLVIAVLFVFYIRQVTNTIWIYRSAMGLFKEVQYINCAAAALNVLLSILLGKIIGIAGIICATGVARILTSFWYEANVVLDKLNASKKKYYKKQLVYLVILVGGFLVSYLLSNAIKIQGILGILTKIVLCSIVWFISTVVLFRKTDEYNLLKNKVLAILNK